MAQGMADIIELARGYYDIAKGDSSETASMKRTYKALVKATMDGSNTGDVVNGSKNQASYTIRLGVSVTDRMTAMRIALRGLAHGIRPARNTRTKFG